MRKSLSQPNQRPRTNRRAATGTITKRGRPKLANPKRQVTLRLDSDVLESLRNSGPGWQSRVNDILRKAVKV